MEALNDTIFIGDLSYFCNEFDLEKLFSPYGLVVNVRIKQSERNNRNLSFGFVQFSRSEEAQNALESLNGVMFLGRSLRLGWAADGLRNGKVSPKSKRNDNGALQSAQILVSFISKQTEFVVTEETLREVCSQFGFPIDASIKKSNFDENAMVQTGYGFVDFPPTMEGVDSALMAITQLQNVAYRGVLYDCGMSDTLKTYLRKMDSQRRHGYHQRSQHQPATYLHQRQQQQLPCTYPMYVTSLYESQAMTPHTGRGVVGACAGGIGSRGIDAGAPLAHTIPCYYYDAAQTTSFIALPPNHHQQGNANTPTTVYYATTAPYLQHQQQPPTKLAVPVSSSDSSSPATSTSGGNNKFTRNASEYSSGSESPASGATDPSDASMYSLQVQVQQPPPKQQQQQEQEQHRLSPPAFILPTSVFIPPASYDYVHIAPAGQSHLDTQNQQQHQI